MGLLDRAVERMKEQGGVLVPDAPEGAAVAAAEPTTTVEAPGEDYGEAPRVRFDAAGLARRGYLVPGQPMEGGLLDEYRRIKRDLLFTTAVEEADPDSRRARNNLLLVTSSVDGEGKTFVATNLAFSIALEVDRTALLVDGDVIRRGATRLLGLADRPGILDVLAGEVDDLGDVIVALEGIPNLRVLPAGRPRPNLNELLASQQMSDLMSELSERYADRVSILDSPPLLMTSEATVLARLAGHSVLVVQADRTPQPSVEQALGLLDEDRFAGLILNRATRHLASDDYGYYEYRDA